MRIFTLKLISKTRIWQAPRLRSWSNSAVPFVFFSHLKVFYGFGSNENSDLQLKRWGWRGGGGEEGSISGLSPRTQYSKAMTKRKAAEEFKARKLEIPPLLFEGQEDFGLSNSRPV